MFDKLMLFLGGALSAIGLSLQGVAMTPGTKHQLAVQIIALCCSGVASGALAVSPSVRGGLTKSEPPK